MMRLSWRLLCLHSVLIYVLLSARETNGQKCGGPLTTNGQIQSPSYPYPHKENITCIWTVDKACNESSVWTYFTFLDFSLENGDSVVINGSAGIQSFTGKKAPFTVIVAISSSITFKSNGTMGLFQAKFDCNECNIREHKSNRAISSPLYPPNYAGVAPAVCSWTFVSSEASATVALSFFSISLTENSYISVYDGPNDQSVALGKFKGKDFPPDQLSSQFSMTLKLQLYVKDKNVSFVAEFASLSPNCSMHHSNVTNALTISPPSNDQIEKQTCVWLFETSENLVFLLNFNALQMNNPLDTLIIASGLGRYSETIQVYTKDMQAMPNMTTSSNKLYIYFTSYRMKDLSTFTLNLNMEAFGGLYDKPGNFSLKTSSKPRGNESVIFNLVVPSGKQVRVNILEPSSLKLENEILFYDLTNGKQELLAAFNNKTTFYPVFSKSNKMLVEAKHFKAQDSFTGQFEGISPGCDQYDSSSVGSYQVNKSVGSNCSWLINPHNIGDEVVSLSFSTLNLGKNGLIKIFRGFTGEANDLLETLNSSINFYPTIYLESKEGLRVDSLFSGNAPEHGIDKMSAFYDVMPGCRKTTNVASGNVPLKSPGYPTRYPLNANCSWEIVIPSNKTLLLNFDDVDIYPWDMLLIYSKINATYKDLIFNITGKSKPDDVIVNHNVTLEWKSKLVHSVSNPVRGFSLDLNVLDCGGSISSEKDEFDIPGKDISHTNSFQCVWIITVAPRDPKNNETHIIQFQVNKQVTSNDKHSVLQIYDGGSLTDKPFPPDNTSSMLSRTNKILIKYSLENSTDKPTFKISYITKSCDVAHQCKNGICMHDDWRCNGENNCGDYSDEDNCNSATPIPATSSSGVSGTWFTVGIFLALIAGVVATLVAPFVIRKIRAYRQRYHDFRTLNED